MQSVVNGRKIRFGRGYTYNENENIRLLNETIVPELEKLGAIINDLHTVCVEQESKIIWKVCQ